MGDIFQHTDHGRIIVSQNIQLQQVRIDRMVIKMGGDNIGIHIICRMLYRSEGVDIFTKRKNDDTARMLSGGTTDTCASLHDPVDLAVSLVHTTLFVIIFHITERCLIRQRTDRSGTESLSRTKDYFCIFMCLTLILTGEVQVDIRLFVSLESQESLKRNIKPHFLQWFSTPRAYLIRHVTTGTAGICFHFVGIKIHIIALSAQIVRT